MDGSKKSGKAGGSKRTKLDKMMSILGVKNELVDQSTRRNLKNRRGHRQKENKGDQQNNNLAQKVTGGGDSAWVDRNEKKKQE